MNIQILTLIALAIFGLYALCISVLELAHALCNPPMVVYEEWVCIDGYKYETGNDRLCPKGDCPKTRHLTPVNYGGYYAVADESGGLHECNENSSVNLYWVEQKYRVEQKK